MTVDKDAPLETVWQGKYISALKRGRWEYVSRTGSTNAVVILAEHEIDAHSGSHYYGRSDGTTGAVVGAVTGGLIGYGIARNC